MRDFQIGDDVYCLRNESLGKVLKIKTNSHFPIRIFFPNNSYEDYTFDGKYLIEHVMPTIYHITSLDKALK